MTAVEELAKKLGVKLDEEMYPRLCGVLLGKIATFRAFKYDDKSGALFDKMFREVVELLPNL